MPSWLKRFANRGDAIESAPPNGKYVPHLHAHWVLIAIVCSVFYRSTPCALSPQLSPSASRSQHGRGRGSRWSEFAVFQLVSGAMQVALVVG
jgi:hypothetical protein